MKLYFSENKIDIEEHPLRVPKPITDQNLFSDAELLCKTMKSKDQAILDKFYVKESI